MRWLENGLNRKFAIGTAAGAASGYLYDRHQKGEEKKEAEKKKE